MSKDPYIQSFITKGWALWPQVLPAEQIAQLRQGIETAYLHCRALQEQQGIAMGMAGTVHHIVSLHPAFMDFLATLPLRSYLEQVLGGPVILNSFGGVLNHLTEQTYVGKIHRDQRTFSGPFALMCNLLVMLDDFKPENGATWVYSGSQHLAGCPDESTFWHNAEQICAPAGSLVMFDSLLWHAAGHNHQGATRRCLTLTFSRPLMKPQFDYLAHLKETEIALLTPLLKQLLGYYSRVPMTLEQWYQKPERRFYQSDQG